MVSRTDVEARLRGYAQEFDREFPATATVERRIIARTSLASEPARRSRELRPRWSVPGVLVRDVAMALALVLLVAALVVGVTKLRGLEPQPSGHPKVGVPIPRKAGSYLSALHFISADTGWLAEAKSSAVGPAVLYRTSDGGRSWQEQLRWDGPGPAQVLFSSDGMEGLVVGGGGVPLFRTVDGGVQWQRMQLPPQATQIALVYFLDTREGWIISYLNEATPGFAGVFHTVDGGQDWSQIARIDVNQEFNHGRIGGSLQGSMMFVDSSTGWMDAGASSGTGLPVVSPFLYMTHDGGVSWTPQTIDVPNGVDLNSGNVLLSVPQFVDGRNGIVLATWISLPTGVGAPFASPVAPSIGDTYVYTTTDGGTHWSSPRVLHFPAGVAGYRPITMIDASTWVVPNGPAIVRTNDAGQTWEMISNGLPADSGVSFVDFQSRSNGWAGVVVGTTPAALTLYRTTDGGAHWTEAGMPSIGG